MNALQSLLVQIQQLTEKVERLKPQLSKVSQKKERASKKTKKKKIKTKIQITGQVGEVTLLKKTILHQKEPPPEISLSRKHAKPATAAFSAVCTRVPGQN